MSENNQALKFLADLTYKRGLRKVKGLFSAYCAFPLSEYVEKRNISTRVKELRKYYLQPYVVRKEQSKRSLMATLEFASESVPYYRDLFKEKNIDLQKIKRDINYLNDIPYLTKDIIREQSERLLSKPLLEARYHHCKTGGSTGASCSLYYDQIAADYATAVSIYTRERISKRKSDSELHFACRFPGQNPATWPTRETLKCIAMNRSNIFFDRLDEEGIEEIIDTLKTRSPHLIHAHPSTIHAVANHISTNRIAPPSITVFESSGELLEKGIRDCIQASLNCQVINRYGSAEFGISAYELDGNEKMYVLDSEVYAETVVDDASNSELVMTSLRNKLMPLIRYRTGDIAEISEERKGKVLNHMVGRIHDYILIGGVKYATHYIQDIIDHRIGNVTQFQIDTRGNLPVLNIVPEPNADRKLIQDMAYHFWKHDLPVQFVEMKDLVTVGRRAKFRHVV
ncbi:phenylacetate--CoA ligase family protein [Vibrio mediterranei]|uniref:Phenylacetate--CoA ligase family protein n=1 Tax=Vibrio mediterranei TaxID=689 RepID=A0A3G4VFR6_9VIBR|nr:phenylacetate--CoA ligase family protein [Vibrio mediterranei]